MPSDERTTGDAFNFALRGRRYRGYQDGTVEERVAGGYQTLSWDEGMKLLLDPAVEWVDRRV